MITNDALLASVKLLASDLDGTLLDPHHKPVPRINYLFWTSLAACSCSEEEEES